MLDVVHSSDSFTRRPTLMIHWEYNLKRFSAAVSLDECMVSEQKRGA
jgi:hypothetical protein